MHVQAQPRAEAASGGEAAVSPALAAFERYRDDPARLKLRRERTVPKRLVRKAAVENVLITDHRVLDGDTWLCSGQIPRAHELINDQPPTRRDHGDLCLMSEITRQAAILAHHRYFGVPRSQKFVFMAYEVSAPPAAPLAPMTLPVPFTVYGAVETRRYRGEALAEVVSSHAIELGDDHVVHTTARYRLYTAAAYRRLRERIRAQKDLSGPVRRDALRPADAALVGRSRPANVLLSAPETHSGADFRSAVLVDTASSFFFDHPDEHVTGMVQFETIRQMATLSAGLARGVPADRLTLTGLSVRFLDFGELELPVECEAHVHDAPTAGALPRVAVDVRLRQPTSTITEANAELAIVGDPAGNGAVLLRERPERAARRAPSSALSR